MRTSHHWSLAPMIRTTLLAIGWLLAITVAGPAKTPELSPTEREEAVKLIAQLGNPSFKIREDASQRLVKFGRAVEPVLRQGFTYPAAEMRRACGRLLPPASTYHPDKPLPAFLANKEGDS